MSLTPPSMAAIPEETVRVAQSCLSQVHALHADARPAWGTHKIRVILNAKV